jgi:hypothetical protein
MGGREAASFLVIPTENWPKNKENFGMLPSFF